MTAYENWIIERAKEIKKEFETDIDCTMEEALAFLLYKGCKGQNPQSFEIVSRVGDKSFTTETFLKAAKSLLEVKP